MWSFGQLTETIFHSYAVVVSDMKNLYCLALIGVILLSVECGEAKVSFKRSLVTDSDKKSEENNDERKSEKVSFNCLYLQQKSVCSFHRN